MNTTTFTTGDIVRFESGKEYKVTGIMPDGQLQVRGQRHGKDFGAIRIIDPARTKLVRRAADQAQAWVEAPAAEAVQAPMEADRFATPEQRKEWLRAFPGTPSAPEPAPVTAAVPVIIPRTEYWEFSTYQHASPAAQATLDAVFAAVEGVTLPYLGVSLDHRTYSVTADFSLPGAGPEDDATHYLVGITDGGELIRLARLRLTGKWIQPEESWETPEPDVEWRTVRQFSQDPVGRVLARDVAVSARPQLPRWMQASTR